MDELELLKAMRSTFVTLLAYMHEHENDSPVDLPDPIEPTKTMTQATFDDVERLIEGLNRDIRILEGGERDERH